jgi:hypothetical protein
MLFQSRLLAMAVYMTPEFCFEQICHNTLSGKNAQFSNVTTSGTHSYHTLQMILSFSTPHPIAH